MGAEGQERVARAVVGSEGGGGRHAIQWEGGTWSRIERRRGGTHTSRDSGGSKEGGRVKGERRSAAAR
eukprot:2265770-Prymnesium_polylepis.1